eukprot:351287-Chlamydomonas_euryale.AAC.2
MERTRKPSTPSNPLFSFGNSERFQDSRQDHIQTLDVSYRTASMRDTGCPTGVSAPSGIRDVPQGSPHQAGYGMSLRGLRVLKLTVPRPILCPTDFCPLLASRLSCTISILLLEWSHQRHATEFTRTVKAGMPILFAKPGCLWKSNYWNDC